MAYPIGAGVPWCCTHCEVSPGQQWIHLKKVKCHQTGKGPHFIFLHPSFPTSGPQTDGRAQRRLLCFAIPQHIL